ncbi:AT-rich interactive domain-containing protein 3C [Tachyglossus aculeatus]|uniref:AT-rich interactive domain-containing protein 3C n=1 Tax=Tachyglossus aculeatus TaxID=9261 RepID=UPI0018F542D3|nr:AT-rich interactive domain-containing protein 3C [Tachyglossus aculeatus]
METLQRQQAARLAQRAGGPPLHPASPGLATPQNHRAARRAHGLGGPVEPPTGSVPGLLLPLPSRALAVSPLQPQEEEDEEEEEEVEEEEEEMLEEEEEEQEEEGPGIGPKLLSPGPPQSSPTQSSGLQPHEWTYEEQFKQLYELDDDPKRKEFLDDLFGFMQKRGTPVNRIPIMAKQVLDLYALFRLVTAKGGLVEVINRKVWREVTKGLSLPTSITSAAFTLRTQYMKYLYPYECETRALSSPGELQAAIDSNRREGRRQGYGTTAPLFSFPPTASAVPHAPALPGLAAHACAHLAQTHPQLHPVIKKEEGMVSAPALPTHLALPLALALGPARGKPGTGEPPEKKAVLMDPEEPVHPPSLELPSSLLSRATPPSMGKGPSREEWQNGAIGLTGGGISSVNMALEINGAIYTGVLFARRPSALGLGINGGSSSSGGGGSGSSQGHASPTLPTPPPGLPPHGPMPPSTLP